MKTRTVREREDAGGVDERVVGGGEGEGRGTTLTKM